MRRLLSMQRRWARPALPGGAPGDRVGQRQAGVGHGRLGGGPLPSGHTVSPTDSQEECVTRRSVLAVLLTNVLQLDYFAPGVSPGAAGIGRYGAEVGGFGEGGDT